LFLNLYFWRAGRAKIGDQKTDKIKVFLIYIFWRGGRGKIGGKKTEENISFIFLKHIFFWKGWPPENRRQKEP
jgi:hypothetical protein